MGYSTAVAHDSASESWTVTLKVNLSRAETNDLFLSGDSILSWPVDGMLSSSDDDRPERSGMFISEIAANPLGLALRYREQAQAERTAAILGSQLTQIGIVEEA
jgi:hypothetical protein